ncbi:MAG TPA: YoaK family protein, partial [Verrucomicrobiae bacterium]|nr:YoaK family protein [Verrucomicrobiae bacterium]
MLCLLAWAAGIVDAVSYLGLGRVFTAMMTGNTVLLALAIGQGESMAILRSALALAGFSVGAATGAFIVSRGRSRDEWPPSVTAAFAFEAVLLAGFTAVWHVAGSTLTTGTTNLLIVLSGLAMGVQAAAVRHLGIPGVATTYLTGTLTSLMAELVG